MSDYFAGLLRSSGVASSVAAAPATAAERMPSMASAQAELPLAAPTSEPELIAEAAAQPPATREARGLRYVAQAESSASHTRVPQVHPDAPSPLPQPATSERAQQAQQEPEALHPPAPETATTARPTARALVDAALRWVAAGDRSDVEPHRSPSAPSAHGLAEGTRHATATAPALQAQGPTQHVHSIAIPARTAVPAPMREPMQRADIADIETASVAHDDAVVVSIGAIHVRVDAPAPQTIAHAPAPKAAPARPAVARSALARRALRRI